MCLNENKIYSDSFFTGGPNPLPEDEDANAISMTTSDHQSDVLNTSGTTGGGDEIQKKKQKTAQGKITVNLSRRQVQNVPKRFKNIKIVEFQKLNPRKRQGKNLKMRLFQVISNVKRNLLGNIICDMIKGNESDVASMILIYRLKEVTDSNVLHCLKNQRFAHISVNQISDYNGVWIKM